MPALIDTPAFEGLAEHEQELLIAFFGAFGSYGYASVWEALSDAEDAYCGRFDSEEQYAEDLVDNCGLLDGMPENLRGYFDYEAFARDLFINDVVLEQGHVFNRSW